MKLSKCLRFTTTTKKWIKDPNRKNKIEKVNNYMMKFKETSRN